MSERDPHTHGPLINNNSKGQLVAKEQLSTKGFIFSINGSGSLDIHVEGKKYDLVSLYL